MKRWALFLVVLFSVSFVLLPGVSGAEEKISGRFVYHTLKVETVEVGDVPGHINGITQNAGLLFYSNGEIATIMGTNLFDYVDGKGMFHRESCVQPFRWFDEICQVNRHYNPRGRRKKEHVRGHV